MAANYDNSAWFYDRLSRAIYGKSIINSQVYLLDLIPANANILIVGGGTGWILEELAKQHHAGLQIDYLDISANMISKAKDQEVGQNQVRFINQSAEEDFEGSNYNIILTPFFFDNFKEPTMRSIFNRLHQKLQYNGLWLYADFQVAGEHQFFQKSLLSIMYTCFRAICNVEANHLPDVITQFAKDGYKLIHHKTFKKEFIISLIYKKA